VPLFCNESDITSHSRTGTSVAFFGNTPPVNSSQWALFSIDNGPASNVSFMDPAPASTRQWYQSSTLPDAPHNITVSYMSAVSLDYAVVTAGQNTPLLGQVVIVDDGDPSIAYAGSWTRSPNSFTSSTGPYGGLPYRNATHQTTSAGSSATFHFMGMSSCPRKMNYSDGGLRNRYRGYCCWDIFFQCPRNNYSELHAGRCIHRSDI
jgi:hypothetical protein